MNLVGRSAVISGASRGIGRAIAQSLASDGARVYLLARGVDDLRHATTTIGPLAVPIICDVADTISVAAAVAAIADGTLGGAPDILVNNAGMFPLSPIESMDADSFARTVDVNLVAPFRLLRALLPAMRARGSGHIVTIGSVADRSIFPGNGAYSASKFGQRAMHEVLRTELQGSGIRSTIISPAATDTPIWDPIDPDNQPGFPSRASMLRPEDVADAVRWAVTRPAHVNIDELRLSSS